MEVGDCFVNNIFVQMNRGTGGKIVTQLLQIFECTARLGVGLGFFAEASQASLDSLDVCQHELGVNDIDIALWVDGGIDMDDIVICKGADNVDDCIALANMSEELIAQPLATGGTSY